MARSFISEYRLLEKINTKLASDDDCRDYTVSSLMREEKDQTGCNWSVAAMSGSDSFTGTASFQAEKIIETFRGLYNFWE